MHLIDIAKRVFLLNRSLYYYRNISSSTTHNYNKTLFDSITRVNNKKVEYAKKWGGIPLMIQAKKRCCLSCLFAINSLAISSLSYKEKVDELNKIYSSDFFIANILYKPENLGLILSMVYWLVYKDRRLLRLRYRVIIAFCLCSKTFLV